MASSCKFPHILIAPFIVPSFSRLALLRSSGRNFSTTMASAVPNRIFQLKLDPLTGNSEWVVVEDEDEDEDADYAKNPPKSFLSSTSYLDMLNDSRRNRAFHEAIKKTITKPCHVLDIGAGTGLLSMMALRAMDSSASSECSASGGEVSACESYLPMVKLMRKVLRQNGLEMKIRIFHKRSDELRVGVDLHSRADVLVSEILDSELLGEGLIPTLQHAHDELLTDNPLTVPYRATTYGQLVQSAILQNFHELCGSEACISDGIQLVPAGLEGVIQIKSQQYAMHCDALSEEIKLLSEPFKVFDFDFSRRPESSGEIDLCVKPIADGTANAIISWWVLQLDREGDIFYSTAPRWIKGPSRDPDGERDSPYGSSWCDHWKQCVWFIDSGMPVFKDKEVPFQAVHSDTSISYNFRNYKLSEEFGNGHHLMLSPERTAIYGDKEWRSIMLTAMRNALKGKSSPLCVVLDDSVFLTVLAASLSNSSHIISFFPGLQEKGSLYLQTVADANGYPKDQVKVLGRRKAALCLDETNNRKVDLLVGEPFYCGYEGMLPWLNLRLWKERTMLDSILSEDVVIMPCKGILKARAMSLPDLWESRRCLKRIEGFDHSVVNQALGACGDSPESTQDSFLSYFIWQCGETEELSEVFTIIEFDFCTPITSCSGKTKVRFKKPGVCHGLAVWIDWVMEANSSLVVSTGPEQRYWKQGVKLLNRPVLVNPNRTSDGGESCFTEVEAVFEATTGALVLKSAFS